MWLIPVYMSELLDNAALGKVSVFLIDNFVSTNDKIRSETRTFSVIIRLPPLLCPDGYQNYEILDQISNIS